MPVLFRKYNPEPVFGEDYNRLRNFLIKLDNHNYSFGFRPYAASTWWTRKKENSGR